MWADSKRAAREVHGRRGKRTAVARTLGGGGGMFWPVDVPALPGGTSALHASLYNLRVDLILTICLLSFTLPRRGGTHTFSCVSVCVCVHVHVCVFVFGVF